MSNDSQIVVKVDKRRRVTLPGDRDLYLATVHPDGSIFLEPAVVEPINKEGRS